MSARASSAADLADTTAAFNAALGRLGPFEANPALAVAESGGRDSMALAMLAHDWIRARDGMLTALIVDHGLRPGSRGEARQVAAWLKDLGIERRILTWSGPKPASRLQERARDARYELLSGWCRRHGVLHLLTAHHRGDQVETVAMRDARYASPGQRQPQSGMPALRIAAGVRLLRPLLSLPRARLENVLAARGQDWVDDPSNDDVRFERVRTRRGLAAASADRTAAVLRTATRAGERRQDRAVRSARLAAACLSLSPYGYAEIQTDVWRQGPADVARDLLRQTLHCIGGGPYPPPRAKVGALADVLLDRADAAATHPRRTLAGCRILAGPERLLIVREPGRLPPPIAIAPGRTERWDRFRVTLSRTLDGGDYPIGPPGADGLRALAPPWTRTLPQPAALSLPALWTGDKLVEIACIDGNTATQTEETALIARFCPVQPLLECGLRVV